MNDTKDSSMIDKMLITESDVEENDTRLELPSIDTVEKRKTFALTSLTTDISSKFPIRIPPFQSIFSFNSIFEKKNRCETTKTFQLNEERYRCSLHETRDWISNTTTATDITMSGDKVESSETDSTNTKVQTENLVVDKDGKVVRCEGFENGLFGSYDEYLLSIHSTKRRSRRRKHIKGIDDIVFINNESIEKAKEDPESRVSKILREIELKQEKNIDSLSFSGGGYNCVYHIGVLKYIFENPNLFRGTKYLGASGGAGIVAVVLCFEEDENRFDILDEMIDEIAAMRDKNLKLYQQVEDYSNILLRYVTRERFDKYIKDSDRCHISITNIPMILPSNVMKTRFSSYEQFVETLRASACIPVILDNKIRKVDSIYCIDGGLSNNLPVLDDKTIKVSCLNYPFLNADIYPTKILKLSYCFTPPPRDYIDSLRSLGYDDISSLLRGHKTFVDQQKEDRELDRCISEILNDDFE